MTAPRTAAARPADGSTPPPVYHWVAPPGGATGAAAVPATGGHATVPLSPAGSVPAGVATADGQVAVSLGAGAVAAAPGQRAVTISITPLDPSSLPSLPDGLRTNGNAYRIAVASVPDGRGVTTFARPGSVTVELPEIGRALYRATGSGWVEVPSTPVPPRELAVSAALTRPGVYVSGTDLPPPVGGTAGPGDDDGIPAGAVVALVGIVLLVALVVAAASRLHARRRVSGSAGTPDPDRGSPDRPSGS